MFSRALPRALPRSTRLAQCDANPQIPSLAKLPSRTWRPVQQQCARRTKATFAQQIRGQYQKSPLMFPLAAGCVFLLATGAAIYIPWYYQNMIVKPYHNFPEPVAKKLRRAIFYSQGKYLDLKEANKYFRQALSIANELGMDPFGPEILGVKYAISNLFEQAGQFPLACDVLEIMRVDCERWLNEFSDNHWTNGNRSRILKVMVQLNVKLGELYDSKYMNQPEDAEKRLVEAVQTVLTETNRRHTDGVKEGEGDFMTDEEIGGTMEALGHHFEQFDNHYLATPLFLQALSLCPPNSCHGVVLMNNISTCLAQQISPPQSPTTTTEPTPRSTLISQARQWATKAIERAAIIAPPDRNEECDIGCVVATHNLGEFLEMEGKVAEARTKYQEAGSLAKAVKFDEGVANSKAGLKRLEGR